MSFIYPTPKPQYYLDPKVAMRVGFHEFNISIEESELLMQFLESQSDHPGLCAMLERLRDIVGKEPDQQKIPEVGSNVFAEFDF